MAPNDMSAATHAPTATPPPLSDEHLQSFEELGFALVDTPLTPAELDAAEAAFDRCCAADSSTPGARENRCEDEGYCAALAQPWFERVASQVLRSERVHLVENLPHHRPPAADAASGAAAKADFDATSSWANGCHIDWQVSTEDFEATPRRDMCAIWLWLSDVTPDTAAMRVLPGSHLPIHRHWQRTLTPEHKAQLLPRNYGLFPRPSEGYPTYPQYIPEPDDFRYSSEEPMAVEAKRGQVRDFYHCPTRRRADRDVLERGQRGSCITKLASSPSDAFICLKCAAGDPTACVQALVFTQSMLHTGWSNFTTTDRKAIIVSWVAAGVPFGESN